MGSKQGKNTSYHVGCAGWVDDAEQANTLNGFVSTYTSNTSTPWGGTGGGGAGGSGGNGYPFSQTITVTGSTTQPLVDTCTTVGHQIDDYGEFPDGSIYAECTRCGQAIRVKRVPSGEALIRTRALVEVLRTASKPEDVDAVLPLLAGLRQEIDAEQETLAHVEDLYRILYHRLVEIGFVE